MWCSKRKKNGKKLKMKNGKKKNGKLYPSNLELNRSFKSSPEFTKIALFDEFDERDSPFRGVARSGSPLCELEVCLVFAF